MYMHFTIVYADANEHVRSYNYNSLQAYTCSYTCAMYVYVICPYDNACIVRACNVWVRVMDKLIMFNASTRRLTYLHT